MAYRFGVASLGEFGSPLEYGLDGVGAVASGAWFQDMLSSWSAGDLSTAAKVNFGFVPDGVGVTKPAVSPPQTLVTVDAQPGDISTTATLTVGAPPIVSTIDTVGDQDFFRIDLVAGQSYEIGMYAKAGGPNLVPLADCYIEIYDAAGNLIVSADGGGPNTPSGLDVLMTFTAEDTGAYFINARAFDNVAEDGTDGDMVGDYELFAREADGYSYRPYYTPDSPLYSIDWGTSVDSASRNPDGDNGPRDNGNAYEGTASNPYGITGKNVITYYLAQAGDVFIDEDPTTPGTTDTMVAKGWSDWEIDSLNLAFDAYENVADIIYVEVDNQAEADFIFVTYNGTPGPGVSLLGRMSPPDEENEGRAEFNALDERWTPEGLAPGGFTFTTLIHEMGHGHGLAHPHDNGGRSGIMNGVEEDGVAFDYTNGDYDLNQSVYTMMSYEDGWQMSPYGQADTTDPFGWLGSLMAFDVAAIQDKYGVNEDYRTGNDTYVIDDVNAAGTYYSCIWDAGGIDAIVYTGTRDATIDLRAATLQYEYGGGGWLSYAYGVFGGYTIANGVTIENATGGDGDDTITGNDANNVLAGGRGADTLDGGAGSDTVSYLGSQAGVYVRLFNQTVFGGEANGDVISGFENATGSRFNDDLMGSYGDNVLSGGAGNDLIQGLAGDDTLIGGAGGDTLSAGDGIDTISYVGSNLAVYVRLFNHTAFGGHANGDVISGFENAIGSSNNDDLMGSYGDNILTGGAGADLIQGLAGNDTLIGGTGGDTLNGGDGVDTVSYAGSGAGVYVRLFNNTAFGGDAAGDLISNIENASGSSFNDDLMGSYGDNSLSGGVGNDQIRGLAGSDTLLGGMGGDTLDGGDGIDTVSYVGSSLGVYVRLFNNTAFGGDANGDSISNVENATGSSNNDDLMGSNGANTLNGGAGADVLQGLGGADLLIGGAGADRFVFSGASGSDTISDFAAGAGAGDVIQLAGSVFTDYADVLAHTNDDGSGNTVISKSGVQITLTGVLEAQLAADDFVFVASSPAAGSTAAMGADTASDAAWMPTSQVDGGDTIDAAPSDSIVADEAWTTGFHLGALGQTLTGPNLRPAMAAWDSDWVW